MAGLSRPIVIGNIKVDARQIVIKKDDVNFFSQAGGFICIASIRTSPPDQVTKVLREANLSLNQVFEAGGLSAFGSFMNLGPGKPSLNSRALPRRW